MDYDAKVIIKTEINNDDFDKDVVDLKSKLGTIGKKFTDLLGRGLTKAVGIGGKAGRIFLSIFKTITKIGLGAVGLSVALAGLVAGAMILAKAFEKAFKDNKQLKTDLQYVKFAIGKAIEPAVNAVANILVKIINFLFKIIQYTAYLIKAWTGWDMFKNATHEEFAKSMQDANKNSSKTAKNAKEINKQLAGFDEMNILSDKSSGTSTESVGTPSFNLSEFEVPKWLEAIGNIGKALKEYIIKNIDDIKEKWGIVKEWFKETIEKIKEIWASTIEWISIKWSNFTMWISEKIKNISTSFKKLWQGIKDGVVNAVQWVKDKFNSIVDFFNGIISKIVSVFKTIGTKVGDAIGGAFKTVINGVLKAIENILNFPIKQINKLLDVINKVPGINISKLSTFNLPRLAKGGIINMPGKGVALGGEVAPEGVIPLTDSQQMAILGEAIGKYVTINATIPVYAYNRQVDRQIRVIRAEDSFAGNR